MRNRKKKNRVLLLLIVILTITIGFALLSTTLFINGTASIKSNTWNIHWDDTSVQETSGSVTATTPAAVTDANKTIIEFAVEFELPGDFYEFTADAVNEGSIDGMISNVEVKFYMADGTTEYDGSTPEKTLPSYITYSLTHEDGTAIAEDEVITHNGGTIGYKFRVGFADVKVLPENPVPVITKIEITPVQHKDETPQHPEPEVFATDSWETIGYAAEDDNLDKYDIGDEKTVQIDIDGNGTPENYKIRIVNKTTPATCSNTGYSQTACGLVLEFVDVIDLHRMNPYTDGSVDGDGCNGGWEHSEMRNYLNSTIYNKLPADLQRVIKPTTVVSGYAADDSANFVTSDKLFLLSRREIWNYQMYADSAINQTRQLDYYAAQGVTTSSYAAAKKKYQGDYYMWWLRPAVTYLYDSFGIVDIDGNGNSWQASDPLGVSPSFKVGMPQ